jgi:hypothetical protein
MKYLFFIYLISYVLTLSCETPVECYLKGIDTLRAAKDVYRTAEDKLVEIINDVKASLEKELNEGKILKLENKLKEVNAHVEAVKNDVQGRVNDVGSKSHQYNCRDGYTACNDDGNGNLFNLDRHFNICDGSEKMLGWLLQRCDDKHYRFQVTCCKHP